MKALSIMCCLVLHGEVSFVGVVYIGIRLVVVLLLSVFLRVGLVNFVAALDVVKGSFRLPKHKIIKLN